MLDQLPRACKAVGTDGIDVERYTLQMEVALTELGDALSTLRSQVEASVVHAHLERIIWANCVDRLTLDYEDHRLELGSYELRAFVDRALKEDVDDAAWIDGIAGLVVGKRLEGWDDTMIDHFGFEMRGIAQKLARRLALIREGNARAAPVTAIHLTTLRRERSGRSFCGTGAEEDGDLKERIRNVLAQAECPDAVLVDLLGEMMNAETRESAK